MADDQRSLDLISKVTKLMPFELTQARYKGTTFVAEGKLWIIGGFTGASFTNPTGLKHALLLNIHYICLKDAVEACDLSGCKAEATKLPAIGFTSISAPLDEENTRVLVCHEHDSGRCFIYHRLERRFEETSPRLVMDAWSSPWLQPGTGRAVVAGGIIMPSAQGHSDEIYVSAKDSHFTDLHNNLLLDLQSEPRMEENTFKVT